jgi:putative ABC transport system ATP-binding protein
MEPAIRTKDLVKVYGAGAAAVRALDGVTLELGAAGFTAIMGASGSGKSTLLHCIAGLDTVTSGHIWLGESEITALDERGRTLLRRDRIGFIFQAFNLLPSLTVAENIELPLAIAGRNPDREWVDTVIDTVGLRDRLHHLPAELSGGQQQRTAAARALAGRPDIVFADEPTGNLDTRSSSELLEFMQRATDEFEQTIVMVTHDPIAAGYSGRVVFLEDGTVTGELSDPTAESVIDLMKQAGD